MKKAIWKQWVLAALLLTLLLGITGCFVKPDNVVDESPTDPIEVLPFPTTTPTPTPDPNQQSGEGTVGGDVSGATAPVVVTTAPTTAPTIAVITPSPTPLPVWTYSPAPTAKPTATDDGTLRYGSTGTAVRNLQQRLKDLGYYTGSVDGDFGAGTETALKEFQRQNGLSADGIAGQRTLSTINSSSAKAKASASPTKAPYATSRPTPKTYTASTPYLYKTLQKGSTRSEVKDLQRRLKELGYYNGSITGSYDDATEAAVTAFQQRNGCYVDGIAGEDTQKVLYGNDALPMASSITPANVTTVNAYRTLKTGMSGDDVSHLQARLKELYYYNGDINGKYELTTELAVKVFQQRNGLTADGVAGSGTLSRVYASSALYAPTAQPTATAYKASGTLQTGSIGEEVYRLQERLFDLGYYTGRIDGIYNDTVAMAVRSFQNANNLTADGKAGATTQRVLYNQNAVKAKGTDDTMATLKEGDEGERVAALQNLLHSYGYFTDEINGKFGVSTTIAVQKFQAMNNLNADGIAGPATNQLLYQGTPKYATDIAPEALGQTSSFGTLRQGMSGPDVMVLQEYLMENGYYTGQMDGEYGATTLVAVQAFQARNSLPVDGVAGAETLALLYSGNALRADGATQTFEEPGGQTYVLNTTPERTSMKEKDEGQDVFDLQIRLAELGFFTGAVDGTYGSDTTSAVRAFQGKNNLTVDGAAGPATLSALYAANVVANITFTDDDLITVDNSVRELEEQRASGAIQASLAGGGVAASLNSSVYYAGEGGKLYVSNSGGSPRKVYDAPASFIHASSKGITFVSGSKIMRTSASGGNPQTLIEAGGITKLSLIGDTMYYLEGSSLVKANSSEDATVLSEGVNDFALDVYQNAAYIASDTGVKSLGIITGEERVLVSSAADQVQLCDSVVFFRSGGSIYRIQNGISVLLLDADATWMGVYRDMVYYISGDRLYRCETNGQNSQVFYDGQTAGVSFVAGKAYITKDAGGEVVEILPVSG